jgi:hypothetical protein
MIELDLQTHAAAWYVSALHVSNKHRQLTLISGLNMQAMGAVIATKSLNKPLRLTENLISRPKPLYKKGGYLSKSCITSRLIIDHRS